jgi:hypothetical protein
MSPGTFLLALVLGAAAIACWTVARYPDRGPTTVTRAIVHVAIAFGAMHLLPPIVHGAAGGGRALVLGSCFAAVLPATVYICLSALWVLRLVQAGARGYR